MEIFFLLQNRLSSCHVRNKKLDRVYAEDQHTQRKLLIDIEPSYQKCQNLDSKSNVENHQNLFKNDFHLKEYPFEMSIFW